MKMYEKVLVVLFFGLLSACSGTGDDFVGEWKNKDGQIIEITRDGEVYFFVEGEIKIPGKISSDGTLEVPLPIGEAVFHYSKSSDTLYGMNQEFKRVGPRVRKASMDILLLEGSVKLYALDNYVYPTTLKDLVTKPTSPELPNWQEGGYVDRLPLDPWKQSYQYQNPGVHGRIDIYSLGPDKQSDDDDIGNWMPYVTRHHRSNYIGFEKIL